MNDDGQDFWVSDDQFMVGELRLSRFWEAFTEYFVLKYDDPSLLEQHRQFSPEGACALTPAS